MKILNKFGNTENPDNHRNPYLKHENLRNSYDNYANHVRKEYENNENNENRRNPHMDFYELHNSQMDF